MDTDNIDTDNLNTDDLDTDNPDTDNLDTDKVSDDAGLVIIAGYSLVDPAERDRVVAAFADLLRRVRRAEGCLDAAITADPIDPRRINNLEVWSDDEALNAWRAVADAPDPGVEFDDSAVKRYRASDGGPLF